MIADHMSASTVIFLALRAAHVLLAVLWVGAVFFMTFFLMPALAESGPAAGPVMGALMRRKLHVFMASIGGTTVLTGFYLYYRFTGGFDPALSGTRAAMVFGTGGLAGLVALILGGAVVAKNAKKTGELGARMATAPEAERGALGSQIAAARQRAETASRIVIVLQIIAVVLMAIGHYV
jgi:uncharacterized membrane protein